MNQNLNRRRGPPRRPVPTRRQHNGGGNARQSYERYMALAREARLAGDDVEMERCYQFAEHYFRVMRAADASDPEGRARSHDRANGDRL
jgi:hypothetical protein